MPNMLQFYYDLSTYFFEHAIFKILFHYFIFFEFIFLPICELSWFLDGFIFLFSSITTSMIVSHPFALVFSF